MNRREALKTLAALTLTDVALAGAAPVEQGVEGHVTVKYGSRITNYTTRQQCINDFARDAVRQYPDAREINLTLFGIKVIWSKHAGMWWTSWTSHLSPWVDDGEPQLRLTHLNILK